MSLELKIASDLEVGGCEVTELEFRLVFVVFEDKVVGETVAVVGFRVEEEGEELEALACFVDWELEFVGFGVIALGLRVETVFFDDTVVDARANVVDNEFGVGEQRG